MRCEHCAGTNGEHFEWCDRPKTGDVSYKRECTGSAFDRWWDEEGSGFPPNEDEDHHEHVKRMCKVAWVNGSYVERNGPPTKKMTCKKGANEMNKFKGFPSADRQTEEFFKDKNRRVSCKSRSTGWDGEKNQPLKNCHACEYLEWVAGEAGDGEGYCCNNRDYQNAKEEDRHLKQLEDLAYLRLPKRCCSIKRNPNK